MSGVYVHYTLLETGDIYIYKVILVVSIQSEKFSYTIVFKWNLRSN